MDYNNLDLNKPLKLSIVIVATIIAILPSIYSLSHGIYEVFPFFYLLPIILVLYLYPRYGVTFSVCISLVFIGLVLYYAPYNSGLLTIAMVWFAIFIAIGVVASSYANRLENEAMKYQKLVETSQDGLFCFDRKTKRLLDINQTGARMLNYQREDLVGRDISVIWPTVAELPAILTSTDESGTAPHQEVVLVARDHSPLRFLLSVILTSNNLVLCSVSDIKKQKLADEEVYQTLEDIERQVRERTAHLEKINEEMKAEIIRRWHSEHATSGKEQGDERISRGRQ